MEVWNGNDLWQFFQVQYRFVEPSSRVMSFGSSNNVLMSQFLSSQQVIEGPEADVKEISMRSHPN